MANDASLAAAIRAAGFASDTPVSLAVVDATGQVRTAVSGQWPDGRAVSTDDRFYAASLTKQITAAAVALLVREGRLYTDAPVSSLLPHLPRWGWQISVRQLVHHTSGLPPAGVLERRLQGSWTTETVLDALTDVELRDQVAFTYSNAGYILLAEIISAASGEAFADYVHNRLGVRFPSEIASSPQARMMEGDLPLSLGDGGLWITARDFADWLQRANRDAYGIEALVTKPGAGAPDYGWGLGIRSFRGLPIYAHGGSWTQASARSVRCPRLGMGVAAMAAAECSEALSAMVEACLALSITMPTAY